MKLFKNYKIFLFFLFCFLILPKFVFAISYGYNSSLVGHWKFDEGVGAKAGDSSGNKNTGSITGAIWTSGKLGKGMNFDGADDIVNAQSPASLDNMTTYTVSAWIKPRTLGEGPTFGRIVDKDQGALTGWYFYLTTVGSAPACTSCLSLYHSFTGTDGAWRSANNSVTLNVWQHIAVTYNTSATTNDPKFYVNGVVKGIIAENTPSSVDDNDAANVFTIGNRTGLDRTFDGLIDDVRVYNRILTAAEVLALYKEGAVTFKAPTDKGLVGYWKFDEGAGAKATDSSGNRNTGTITGATWTSGKLGKGLSFDKIDDIITAPAQASLNNLGPVTLSVWIKPRSVGEGNSNRIIGKSGAVSSGSMNLTLQTSGSAINNCAGASTLALVFAEFNSAASDVYAGRCGANNTATIGVWQHIVATWDGTAGTSGVHIYKNGVEISYAAQGTTSGSLGDDSALTFNIGNRPATDMTIDGTIDDVRVYNRVLSAAEIQTLYQSGAMQFK